MKNGQDKKIDDLFKKGLENPEQQAGYREEDWDALEERLDQRKKRRRVVYLWPLLSGVAALMLLFFGWWLWGHKTVDAGHRQKAQSAKINILKIDERTLNNSGAPKNNDGQLPKQTLVKPDSYAAKNTPGKTIIMDGAVNATAANPTGHDTLSNQAALLAAPLANTNNGKDSVFKHTYAKNHPLYKGTILSRKVNNSNVWANNKQMATLSQVNQAVNSAAGPVNASHDFKNSLALLPVPRRAFNLPSAASANIAQIQFTGTEKTAGQPLTADEKSTAAMMKLLENTSMANDNKPSGKTHASFKPRFTGTVMGAQDVSGAGSFKQGKVGSKAGLVFAAGVAQKLTVSAGAVYSSTPYSAGYDSFNLPYEPKVAPASLTANCEMLDIPVNIGYQVYNKGKNTVSLGTGLSSYIMLQQDYNFVYPAASGVAPKDYSVPNSSSYLFKILNLNATYQRKISSKAGITVQPYLKLPLADIGYSQVKLQTTGVAVGLSWSLDSSQP